MGLLFVTTGASDNPFHGAHLLELGRSPVTALSRVARLLNVDSSRQRSIRRYASKAHAVILGYQ